MLLLTLLTFFYFPLLILGSDMSFEDFIHEFNKTYKDTHPEWDRLDGGVPEIRRRKAIYTANLKKLETLRKEHPDLDIGITQFSDWSEEELHQFFPEIKTEEMTEHDHKFRYWLKKELNRKSAHYSYEKYHPVTLDWREMIDNWPVKDQNVNGKSCGACYAFATAGSIEAMYAIHHLGLSKHPPNLSEQELVDCANAINGKAYEANHGCLNGTVGTTFRYIEDVKGIMPANYYPYNAINLYCRRKELEALSSAVFWISAHANFHDLTDKEMQDYLIGIGPIIVGIDANHPAITHYHGGIIRRGTKNGTVVNHSVLLVGYGHDQGKNIDYWILRNSWGKQWGEKGYFRLERGFGQLGVNKFAYFPIRQDFLNWNVFYNLTTQLPDMAFEDFRHKFNKKYQEFEDEKFNDVHRRKAIFKESVERLESLRKEHPDVEFGITQFFDWTEAELDRFMPEIKPREMTEHDHKVKEWLNRELSEKPHYSGKRYTPISLDWSELIDNWTVKAQDQDPRYCGACWAFVATGAIEALYAIHNVTLSKNPPNLSEQELINCANSHQSYEYRHNEGCDSGDVSVAFQYIHEAKGIMETKYYPYNAIREPYCKRDVIREQQKPQLFWIDGQAYFDNLSDKEMIKYLISMGPFAVAINGKHPTIISYHGGIIRGGANWGDTVNHAVLLVGYGHDYGRNIDYWILRNSWGRDWGEKGYFRVERGSNQLGINQLAYFAIREDCLDWNVFFNTTIQ